jgi:PleD family two-component response regulator
VLIVEQSLEQARFIEDALAEAQERRVTSLAISCFHLEEAEDAVTMLQSEKVDAILLAIDAPTSDTLESFLAIRQASPQVAVIAIVWPEGRDFARTLLRRGAQDYLLRGEFDYVPLARALENAIDRHRLLFALETAAASVATPRLVEQP